MAKVTNERYEELMRKGLKYDLLVSKIQQNTYISEYGLEGRIKADDEVVSLVAMFEPDFKEELKTMIADKKAEVAKKKAEEEEA